MQFSIIPSKSYIISCDFTQEEFDRKLMSYWGNIENTTDNYFDFYSISYLGTKDEPRFNIEKSLTGRGGSQESYITGEGNITSAAQGINISITYYVDSPKLGIMTIVTGIMAIVTIVLFIAGLISPDKTHGNLNIFLVPLIGLGFFGIVRSIPLLMISTFHNQFVSVLMS